VAAVDDEGMGDNDLLHGGEPCKARRRRLSGGLEEDGMLPWFYDL